jgi:protein gp37
MTKIEWTDRTWNPVTGCTKVSQGCKFCYAERQTKRFGRTWQQSDFTKLLLHPDRLDKPLSWKTPSRIFVNSMSDLFHEDIPTSFIIQVFEVMRKANWHTFQVLTKRPLRMESFMKSNYPNASELLKNVWLGVSIENQQTADFRIPILMDTPAAIRFLSCEPILGFIDLALAYKQYFNLDWIIAGGESGPNARPMHPLHIKRIQAQAQAHDIAFFFKQWGEYLPVELIDYDEIMKSDFKSIPVGTGLLTTNMTKVGKKKAGNTLNGKTYEQYPANK